MLYKMFRLSISSPKNEEHNNSIASPDESKSYMVPK